MNLCIQEYQILHLNIQQLFSYHSNIWNCKILFPLSKYLITLFNHDYPFFVCSFLSKSLYLVQSFHSFLKVHSLQNRIIENEFLPILFSFDMFFSALWASVCQMLATKVTKVSLSTHDQEINFQFQGFQKFDSS